MHLFHCYIHTEQPRLAQISVLCEKKETAEWNESCVLAQLYRKLFVWDNNSQLYSLVVIRHIIQTYLTSEFHKSINLE